MHGLSPYWELLFAAGEVFLVGAFGLAFASSQLAGIAVGQEVVHYVVGEGQVFVIGSLR